MIKKLPHVIKSLILACLSAGQVYAADFNAANSGSPAQILIQNASVKTPSGNKNSSIRLVAKDNRNLHENQVYQAYFMDTSSGSMTDASYDTEGQQIFIERLQQAGSMVHQITLRQVGGNPFEFSIVEINTSVVKDTSKDLFFDPTLIRPVQAVPPKSKPKLPSLN
jgi:hypothetical protein